MRSINFFLGVLLALCLFGCKQGDSAPSSSSAAPEAAQSVSPPQPKGPVLHIDPDRAMQYVKEIVAIGPRWDGSHGQQKMADYLRNKLKADHLTEDAFTADTPAGKLPMRNFVARFQGARDGIIVLGSHIDTNYPLRNTNYVGANDGASSTALLLAIADQLRGKNWKDTAFGWHFSMAKRQLKSGLLRTAPMAAVIWRKYGSRMGPFPKSKPFSWRT
jgi:hypothetical protein